MIAFQNVTFGVTGKDKTIITFLNYSICYLYLFGNPMNFPICDVMLKNRKFIFKVSSGFLMSNLGSFRIICFISMRFFRVVILIFRVMFIYSSLMILISMPYDSPLRIQILDREKFSFPKWVRNIVNYQTFHKEIQFMLPFGHH